MDIVVTGIGLVSALGALNETWSRVNRGESGIRVQQPFPELRPRPIALIGSTPTSLLELTRQVVAAAVADAGLTSPLLNCGVVIGSSRSQQPVWEQLLLAQQQPAQHSDDREAAQPPQLCAPHYTHNPLSSWLNTLPHMAAIAAAHQVGATGPVLAPMAACATGMWAIAQGYELLQTKQCDCVIAGAIEAPVSPLTLVGFDQAGALAATGAYPFDRCREGLALGEGAAVLVMESHESAARRSAPIYGRVLGFGLTADGYHVSAPEPTGRMGAIAIKQCLERSGLTPDAVDYIHAHGTATQLNDRNEAQLIQRLFLHEVPVSSTKGATGHTLGASGAIGAAMCLMALQQQTLPPSVGLKEPEFGLNLITASTAKAIKTALCFGFGFGGQNAVIAFGA